MFHKTALHIAVMNGNLDIIGLLLSHQAIDKHAIDEIQMHILMEFQFIIK